MFRSCNKQITCCHGAAMSDKRAGDAVWVYPDLFLTRR